MPDASTSGDNSAASGGFSPAVYTGEEAAEEMPSERERWLNIVHIASMQAIRITGLILINSFGAMIDSKELVSRGLSYGWLSMKERISDSEYVENVRNHTYSLAGNEVKISVFTHDSRRIISYEGKIIQVGENDLLIEITRDDLDTRVRAGESRQIHLVDIHSIAAGDQVILFVRDRGKLD